MARINFSALVESIVGKLAGSVFQDSYQGYQIRTRVSPRNLQSTYQQLRRGEFAFLQQSWRNLSDYDRQTWIDNAPDGLQGINFYLSCNINLTLINQAVAPAYEPAAVPAIFELQINNLGDGIFTISAAGGLSVVPDNTYLLLQATYEKLPTKIFTNPSQFSPIISFPPGTDLSTPVDISADWISRYGQFTTGKRICLKSNLVNQVNGLRSGDFIVCAVESTIITDMFYLASISQSGTSDPVLTVIFNNTEFIVNGTRLGVGIYRFAPSGTFDPLLLSGGLGDITPTGNAYSTYFPSVPAFDVQTFSDFFVTPADGILNNTLFSIVVDTF